MLQSAIHMVDTVHKPSSAPTASQVVASLAGHAELPAPRVRELLADAELARLVGGLIADADAAIYRDETVGMCLPRRAVGELLGGISRQAVAKRDGVDLLAVRQPGRRLCFYPACQFDGARPLDGLADILAVLGPTAPDGDGWAMAAWLCTPNALCGEHTPEAALRDGELEAVRTAAVRQAAAWAEN